MTRPRFNRPLTKAELDAKARKAGYRDWAEYSECYDAMIGGSNPVQERAIEKVEQGFERIESGFQKMRPGVFEPRKG